MKSVTIIFICALAFGLSFLACDPKAKKIEAFNDIVSTSIFQDTAAMTYSLYSDSLILEFAQAPKMKHWYGEVLLIKSDPYKELIIPFPNKTKEEMGHVTLEGKRLTLLGFHIPSDSLHQYFIHLRAVPYVPGFRSHGYIYQLGYLFYSEHDGSNKLRILELVHDDPKITSIDLVKLKNMSPELRDFCRDSIYNSFYMTITDTEIEESKYAF